MYMHLTIQIILVYEKLNKKLWKLSSVCRYCIIFYYTRNSVHIVIQIHRPREILNQEQNECRYIHSGPPQHPDHRESRPGWDRTANRTWNPMERNPLLMRFWASYNQADDVVIWQYGWHHWRQPPTSWDLKRNLFGCIRVFAILTRLKLQSGIRRSTKWPPLILCLFSLYVFGTV